MINSQGSQFPDASTGFVSLRALVRVLESIDGSEDLKRVFQDAFFLRGQESEGWGEGDLLERAHALLEVLSEKDQELDPNSRFRVQYVVTILKGLPQLLSFVGGPQLRATKASERALPHGLDRACQEVNALGLIELMVNVAQSFGDMSNDRTEMGYLHQIQSALVVSPEQLRTAIQERLAKSKYRHDPVFKEIANILLMFADRWQDLKGEFN